MKNAFLLPLPLRSKLCGQSMEFTPSFSDAKKQGEIKAAAFTVYLLFH